MCTSLPPIIMVSLSPKGAARDLRKRSFGKADITTHLQKFLISHFLIFSSVISPSSTEMLKLLAVPATPTTT